VFASVISRLKQQLAGRQGNRVPCPRVPEDVKKKVNEILKEADAKKEAKKADVQYGLKENSSNHSVFVRRNHNGTIILAKYYYLRSEELFELSFLYERSWSTKIFSIDISRKIKQRPFVSKKILHSFAGGCMLCAKLLNSNGYNIHFDKIVE